MRELKITGGERIAAARDAGNARSGNGEGWREARGPCTRTLLSLGAAALHDAFFTPPLQPLKLHVARHGKRQIYFPLPGAATATSFVDGYATVATRSRQPSPSPPSLPRASGAVFPLLFLLLSIKTRGDAGRPLELVKIRANIVSRPDQDRTRRGGNLV